MKHLLAIICILMQLGSPAFAQQSEAGQPAKVPPPIVPLSIEPSVEVVDPATIEPEPAQTQAAPEAVDAPEAPTAGAEGELFIDPEIGMLAPAAPPDESVSAEAESGFQPSFEWGGNVRARLGQDLAYERTLVQVRPQNEAERMGEVPDGSVRKIGTEDVVDYRNSFRFWTRLNLHERVQAFAELYAEYSVVGKRNDSEPTVLFNGKQYRHDFRLEPWEIYFDFFFGPFDLRVGNQIISWGTMTVMSPSNRINPRDTSSYYWSDVTGSRQPIIALRGIYHAWDMAFEFVISPFFKAPPLDLYGGDYSLFRYGSAYGFLSYPGEQLAALPLLDHYVDPSKTIGLHPEMLTTRSPNANPINSQLGARISGLKGGVEFELSYWYGYEEMPTTRLDSDVRNLVRAISVGDTNYVNGYADRIENRIRNGERVEDLFLSEYRRKHSVAAAMGATVWELGLKAEMAFLPDKTYYTGDLRVVTHHTLTYATGIDVIKTDLGALSTLFLDIELFGSHLFGVDSSERLMFSTATNLGLWTTLRFAFLDDDLELEFVNQTNFSTKDLVFIPRVSYSPVQNLRLTLGLMFLEAWAKEPAGAYRFSTNVDRKDTMFGRFSNNDQAFFMVSYDF